LAAFSHRRPDFPIDRRGVGRWARPSAVNGFVGRVGVFQRRLPVAMRGGCWLPVDFGLWFVGAA
ncbi:MAG: hypothetical protein WAW79_08070, partial [Steroidobacteraceae bacterium]